MSGPRLSVLSILWLPLVAAGALAAGGPARGQASGASRQVLDRFAPPAIERGISPLTTQSPDSSDVQRRRSIRAASAVVDRTGASGARYVAGKVIVKFRETASPRERTDSVRTSTRAGAIQPRRDYANFDIVS